MGRGIIVTPQATKFVDGALLEHLTGYPVRSEYKRPEEPDVLPRADAIVVFPATFNTLNKWVLGISDTLAPGVLCEYLGLKMPMVAVPCVLTNSGLDSHPAFLRSIALLREYGVHIIYEPEKYPPKNEVPWDVILETLRVGLIGYGAIGQEVFRLVAEHASEDITIAGALVRDLTRPRPPGPPLVTTPTDLVATRPHVVVEVAGHEGLRAHSSTILRAGIDLLLMSIGALAEPTVLQELLETAQSGEHR